MTLSALFFLGLIVARPGSAFIQPSEHRECKLSKGKMACENNRQEYRLNYPPVHYEYH